MDAVLNPLDRLREQRALGLLTALQDDLRAQQRLEDEATGRRGGRGQARNAQQRLQRKIARLADPLERERLWSRVTLPQFQDTPVNDLPKTREFWAQVDVTAWTRKQLDVASELLDLGGSSGPASGSTSGGGKKAELVARIQDWVHAPEIRARREAQDRTERERELVLASGCVFACGYNFNGELGVGDRRARGVLTEIEAFRGQHVRTVVSGFDTDFAFALTSDGRVFVWGGGGRAVADSGETGDNPSRSLQAKYRVHTKVPPFQTQPMHAVALAESSQASVDSSSCFLLPHHVSRLTSKRLHSIACARSDGHIAFTTSDGVCYTWGRNEYGELGIEGDASAAALASVMQPVPVTNFNALMGSAKVAQVSVGNCHTAAVTDTGDLFVWGGCWSGQLGLGVTKRKGIADRRKQLYYPTPTPVEAFAKRRITKVSCGAVHTAAICSSGQLFTFGCGDGGRLGLGSNADSAHPELVTALERDVVLDVVCCSWHSLCLVRMHGDSEAKPEEGHVFAFGNGLHGQLGLGKQKIASLPTRLPELVHRRVLCRAIAASSLHSCALSADGRLFTWGQNASGCLGRETVDGDIDSAEPEVVETFSGYGVGPIVSIACGHRFTLVVTGEWHPHEPKPQFDSNARINRHAKFAARQTDYIGAASATKRS